ncbi:mediator complex subunit 13 C-terminal-domain-containing protein [Lipomyces orientalis]|uniref:Mediator complex subunit 13 C-terminal-domain-containing protein n=1 Tax=Lipomyces orientalis TaxID=1233043 RepID=A0ACC3TXQ7_9ASCO
MTASPEKNFSNVFKVEGTFDQIRYCVFVDPLSRPLKILLAEWSLRQKLRTSLVAYHNKELWTFSLNEETNPALPDSSFGLKEISTGSFLPSTLTISDSTSPQAFPAAYVPLMLAFTGLLSRHLTADYDYIPMGSVLLSPTQSLLHFNLRLISSGTLLLVPHYQQTTLCRLSSTVAEPDMDTKLILAPNGVHASFAGKATELPIDASTILSCMYMSSGYRVLNEESWCKVRIDGSSVTCFWPSELCFMLPPWKTSGDAADMEWFRMGDPLDEVEEFVLSSLRRYQSTDSSPSAFSQKDAVGNVATQKNPAAVYPTPPDPAQIQNRPPTAPTGADTENGEYPLSSKWTAVDDDGETAIREIGVAEEDDGLLLGDAEEVTEADFNFFDDDHGSNLFGDTSDNELNMADDTDFLNHDMNEFNIGHIMEATTDELLMNQERNQTITRNTDATDSKEPANRIITPPLSPLKVVAQTNAAVVPLKRKSVFAPLTFRPNLESALDNKYSLGGRFYVPEERSDSSESEDESDDGSDKDYYDYQDSKTAAWSDRPDKRHDSPDSRREQPAEDFMSDAYVARQLWWTLLSNSTVSRDGCLLSAVRSSSRLTQSFLQNADSSRVDIENILQTLCEFVVWDSSMLDSFMPPTESRCMCGPDFVNVLKAIFGQIQRLSLQEYALVSDTSSMPASDMFAEKESTQDQEVLQNFMLQVDIFDVGLPGSPFPSTLPTADNPIIVAKPLKSVFYIDPPHFSFMRMNSVLEVRPPALRFWQIFGFAPESGRKDVVSFMIYPGSQGMTSAASAFLGQLKPVYEGSSLGNFVFGDAGEFKTGLVPVGSTARTTEEALEDLRKTCVLLGRSLADFVDGLPNIVIFVAWPLGDPSSLLHISHSVFQLKQEYVDRLGSGMFANACSNVVFEVLPAGLFAAKEALVVPSQYKLVKFALAVYDKCRPQAIEDNASANRYPAYTLARARPARIDFKLTPTPSPWLFAENTCVHVAYGRSRDRRFVTVAWADQHGELARVKPFALVGPRKDGGSAGRPPRSWEDICGEIWERTIGLLPRVGIRWRLVFAKVGTMEQDEFDVWMNLASHAPENITATFVCVDTNPSLSVQTQASDATAIYSTPVATPQRPRIESPSTDTAAAAAAASTTPAALDTSGTPTSSGFTTTATATDQDPGVLVDLKDETYGVVMNHKLRLDPLDVLSVRFSVASGYLVKPSVDDNSAVMSVFELSVLYAAPAAGPAGFETGAMSAVVEDLLRDYRRLAAYGAAAGVCDGRNGVLPWHVAAVDKMQRVLCFLL